jgi:excisionase family DNA binding protein
VPLPEACKLLSVGLSHLYALVKAGELKGFHSGRAHRVTVASIRGHIAKRIAAATSANTPQLARRRGRRKRAGPQVKPKTAAPQRRRARTDQYELNAD